jgi:hypothetical protein
MSDLDLQSKHGSVSVHLSKSAVRLIGFDAAMALAIVVLYSPGLLALSPSDPSILKAGLSIVLGVIIGGSLIYRNVRPLLPTQQAETVIAPHDATSDDVTESLKQYADGYVYSDVADRAIEQVQDADERVEKARRLLDARFGKGTMTNDRFLATVNAAADTVRKNCVALANTMSVCDEDELERLLESTKSNSYKDEGVSDETMAQRRDTYAAMLTKMKSIASLNERLLDEMDKTLSSIADLENKSDKDTERTMDELQEMTKDLRFYKQEQ